MTQRGPNGNRFRRKAAMRGRHGGFRARDPIEVDCEVD
jgi:hypothetical protein